MYRAREAVPNSVFFFPILPRQKDTELFRSWMSRLLTQFTRHESRYEEQNCTHSNAVQYRSHTTWRAWWCRFFPHPLFNYTWILHPLVILSWEWELLFFLDKPPTLSRSTAGNLQVMEKGLKAARRMKSKWDWERQNGEKNSKSNGGHRSPDAAARVSAKKVCDTQGFHRYNTNH